MRRATVAGLAAVLLLGMTGCAPLIPDACPAIGWINEVTVDTSAYENEVFVQLCTDAGCSDGPGEQEPTVPPTDLSVPQGHGADFSFGMVAPEVVTVRVYDAAGILLAESEYEIDWTLSTERCGGPSTAPPLVLAP